ncbi:hypothetical protein [Leptospira adleri]|uniref:Lipoprotein n=1 Tax=Leptospira adleri TaxID=2023186 RepID=A0A2M9YJQ0_9LEPT|nr:hypothetical protein [Leptospira adleri]PJZ51771.1 hypothetical protein CH380_18700 [Leptospira adleri]PJZ60352.1 hypothetical protein CH376_18975 [Leptospira adleri]
MKSNIMKLAAIAAFMVVLSACKPKDKDDNTTIGALVLLLDQTSGNCATVQKNSATTYTATLSAIPKGGCNQATLLGSDLASSILLGAARFDAISALSTSLGCSAATNTAIANAKTAAAATTQATFDALVAQFRYFPISDLRVEAIVPLSAAGSTLTTLGFSQAEILSLNRLTLDQTKLAQTTQLLGTYATGAADAACGTAIANNNKTAFAGILGLDSTATTKATVKGIASANCQYGSAPAATSKCATLNTEF